MRVTVELEDAAIIAVAALKEEYKMIREDVGFLDRVSKKRELLSYEKEDYNDYKKILKALKRVIKYYSTTEEFNKFMEEVKNGS